jgi:hypothetical protein
VGDASVFDLTASASGEGISQDILDMYALRSEVREDLDALKVELINRGGGGGLIDTLTVSMNTQLHRNVGKFPNYHPDHRVYFNSILIGSSYTTVASANRSDAKLRVVSDGTVYSYNSNFGNVGSYTLTRYYPV